LIGEHSGEETRESGGHPCADNERDPARAGEIVEVEQRPYIVEIITHGHDRRADVQELRGDWGVSPTLGQYDHVHAGRHVADPARIDRYELERGHHGRESSDNAVSDNPSTDDGDPAHQRSGSSSGRQPPCCGGVPPVPRSRYTVAVMTIMKMAKIARRRNFISMAEYSRRRNRPYRPNH
jgi:hypothetical protein